MARRRKSRSVRRVTYKPRPRTRRRSPRTRRARKNPGNTMLWLALLGGGAYLLWRKSQAAKAAAAPAALPAKTVSEDASGSVSATLNFGGSLGTLGGSTLG